MSIRKDGMSMRKDSMNRRATIWAVIDLRPRTNRLWRRIKAWRQLSSLISAVAYMQKVYEQACGQSVVIVLI